MEVVQQSESVPTRVLSPKDLEIVNSTMQLDSGHAGEAEIRNNGSVPYVQTQLRFAFLDRNGRVLAAKDFLISRTLMPGKSIQMSQIRR